MTTGGGQLFALEAPEVARLLACVRPAELEQVLDGVPRVRRADLDRAWKAIDRCLAARHTEGLLERAILGGKPIDGSRWLVVRLVHAHEVPGIAEALEELDEESFRACFEAVAGPEPEGESPEEDVLYAWNWFRGLRAGYRAAARRGLSVVFAGDLRRRTWRSREAS